VTFCSQPLSVGFLKTADQGIDSSADVLDYIAFPLRSAHSGARASRPSSQLLRSLSSEHIHPELPLPPRSDRDLACPREDDSFPPPPRCFRSLHFRHLRGNFPSPIELSAPTQRFFPSRVVLTPGRVFVADPICRTSWDPQKPFCSGYRLFSPRTKVV